ncbi:MAG: hypothetical protein QN651_10780 [Nitrososphaeraceae archaeon]|nr:hypothetical protein [Nitrososphaeraceae archaeon]
MSDIAFDTHPSEHDVPNISQLNPYKTVLELLQCTMIKRMYGTLIQVLN